VRTHGYARNGIRSPLGGQVPFAPVYTAADIAHDPHFIARDMIVALEHPGCEGEFAVAGVPIKMTETPGSIRRRAPILSEHAAEVLAGVGIGDERLRDLRSRGVVR
jgi:crotonobetainyl-CoA:carnitine CoA-transferase CaiB-like acyl-CoA transferase